MLEKTNKNWISMTDKSIIEEIGFFVKNERLQQNLTQAQVAKNAGINRWTLSQLENGEGVTLLSFIQIIRALNCLHIFDTFNIEPQISPIKLAEMEQKKRQRATKTTSTPPPKSDW